MEDFKTLPELFTYVVQTYKHEKFLNKRANDEWKSYSVSRFEALVRHLVLGLHNLGIERGEGIALLASSSPEWIAIDLAIMIARGITVPIFKKISPESLSFELADSRVRYLFLGDAEELEFVTKYGGKLAAIIPFNRDDPNMNTSFFDKLIETGERLDMEDKSLFMGLLSKIREDDIASIVYTSGSTGLPKGVELTHRNIVSQVKGAFEILPLDSETDIALSALPLAHIFERMVGYYDLSRGVPVYYIDNIKNLGPLMASVKPTVMTVVPRILEKAHARIKASIDETKGIKKLIASAAFAHAEKPRSATFGSRILDGIYGKLVYSKFGAAFGGRLRYLICGASSLPPLIGRFVDNIGIPLYEGYGLTEASPVIAANCPRAKKLGTVGKVYPGVEMKIGDDEEILTRGPNVMHGYHNFPEATRDAIDAEGWLHTGDLGSIDKDGFLAITGRKKELFKKSTGEYVPPIPIEQAITRHELIDAAMVIADGREVTTCLLFPDFENLSEYKKRHGFSQATDEEFLRSQWLKNNVGDFIEEVNVHLHHCEKVRRFAIIEKPVSIETGELTPTLKIRRGVIEEKYKAVIDSLYNGDGSK
jgi:long-chain acyl-CoA synthetase